MDTDTINDHLSKKVAPKLYFKNIAPEDILFEEAADVNNNEPSDSQGNGSSSSTADASKRLSLPGKRKPTERKGGKKFFVCRFPLQGNPKLTVVSPAADCGLCALHHGNWAKNPDFPKNKYTKEKINEASLKMGITSKDFNTGSGNDATVMEYAAWKIQVAVRFAGYLLSINAIDGNVHRKALVDHEKERLQKRRVDLQDTLKDVEDGAATKSIHDKIAKIDQQIKTIRISDQDLAEHLVKAGVVSTGIKEMLGTGGYEMSGEYPMFRPRTKEDTDAKYQPVYWFPINDPDGKMLFKKETEEKRSMEEDEALSRNFLVEDQDIKNAYFKDKVVYVKPEIKQLAYTDPQGNFHPARALPHFRVKRTMGTVVVMTEQATLFHNPNAAEGKASFGVTWVPSPSLIQVRAWQPTGGTRPSFQHGSSSSSSSLNFDDPAPGVVPAMTTDLPPEPERKVGEKHKRSASRERSMGEKKAKVESKLERVAEEGDDYSLQHAEELAAMKSMDLPLVGDPTPMDDDATRSGFEQQQTKPPKTRGGGRKK